MSLTKGQIIFRVLLAGVFATGGLFIYKMIKTSAQKKQDVADADAKAAAAAATHSPEAANLQKEAAAIKVTPDGFPLQIGSTDAKTGGDVSKVQEWLLANDASALPKYGADGKFGVETETAVKKQIDPSGTVSKDWYDANVSGVVDPAAQALVGLGTVATSGSVPVYNYTTKTTVYKNKGEFVMTVDRIAGGNAYGHIYVGSDKQDVSTQWKWLKDATASFDADHLSVTGKKKNNSSNGKKGRLARYDINSNFD